MLAITESLRSRDGRVEQFGGFTRRERRGKAAGARSIGGSETRRLGRLSQPHHPEFMNDFRLIFWTAPTGVESAKYPLVSELAATPGNRFS
jgi:hypothetical protein